MAKGIAILDFELQDVPQDEWWGAVPSAVSGGAVVGGARGRV